MNAQAHVKKGMMPERMGATETNTWQTCGRQFAMEMVTEGNG